MSNEHDFDRCAGGESCIHCASREGLQKQIKEARYREEELRKALNFYGLVGNYQGHKDGQILSAIDRDTGKIARVVLQALYEYCPNIYCAGAVREVD